MKRSMWIGTGLVAALGTLPAMFSEDAMTSSARVAPDGSSLEISLDPDDGMALLELIRVAQKMLDTPIHYTITEVKDVRIIGLGKQTVPRPEFRAFFEMTLLNLNFVAVEESGGLWIRSTTGAANASKPGYLKTRAVFVPREQLAAWADRGAIITTTVALKTVNAQEAMNMLQSYFTDPLIESVRAVSIANSLVITGYATSLARVSQILDALEASGAGNAPATRVDQLDARIARLEEEVAALRKK